MCFLSSFSFVFFIVFIIKFELYKVNADYNHSTTTTTTAQTTTFEVNISNTIINPHDFKYLLNPGNRVCGKNKGKDIFLLVYVHSTPENLKRRLAIRETWSNIFQQMRIVFMMGAKPDKNITSLLGYEYSIYGDIVQEDFYDSYRNLTYKGIMALKWINEYCSNVKYLLKIDDDIIVNMFLLWRHLKHLDKYNLINNKTILCNVWSSMRVLREKSSKWYVSKDEYKNDHFGRYCSGSAFLITTDLVGQMFNISKYIKFFWVDDYYVSGLLARASNATYYRLNSLYSISSSKVQEIFETQDGEFKIFGHVSKSLSKFYYIWSIIYERQMNLLSYLPNDTIKDIKTVQDFKWSIHIFEPYMSIFI